MTNETIKDPGSYQTPGSTRTLLIVFVAIGAAAFALGLKSDPERAWASFVHAHFYFMSLAIGGLFFAAINWLTGAMWSSPISRVSESFTSYLPIAVLSFLVLGLGIHHIYPWSHPEHVKGDIILEGKAGYLSTNFFIIRNLIGMVIWILFAKKMVGNSVKQDQEKTYARRAQNKAIAPVFLILFAITFTMTSFDTLMSLDPHWFSTMFGVYCFAGLFYSTLALTCLVVLHLKSAGKLEGIVNDNHLHDLGKYMFAFTVFWAYIGFSQFMLIWYANLPEETGYFMRRFEPGWFSVSVFLLVGKFLLPFFLLLPRDSKRNVKVLKIAGVWMLFAQWIDVLWMVQPEFFKDGPVIGAIEVGVTLGFAGLFGLMVTRFLGKHSVVAIGDPYLPKSVFHHHQ